MKLLLRLIQPGSDICVQCLVENQSHQSVAAFALYLATGKKGRTEGSRLVLR